MRLYEESVHADRQCSAHQIRHHGSVAAGDTGLGRRLLNRMRGIEDHRTAEPPHLYQSRHIDYQPAVTEGRASLREPQVPFSACAGDHLLDLLYRPFHVPRRHELAFLDVDNPSGLRCRLQEVGLTA